MDCAFLPAPDGSRADALPGNCEHRAAVSSCINDKNLITLGTRLFSQQKSLFFCNRANRAASGQGRAFRRAVIFPARRGEIDDLFIAQYSIRRLRSSFRERKLIFCVILIVWLVCIIEKKACCNRNCTE